MSRELEKNASLGTVNVSHYLVYEKNNSSFFYFKFEEMVSME